MSRLHLRFALGALTLAVLGACGAGSGEPTDGENGPGEAPLVAESCTDCESREGVRATCEESKLGTRLLRRLTKGELEQTLADIFPEAAGALDVSSISLDSASKLGFTTDAAGLLVSGQFQKELLGAAEDVADQLTSPDVLDALLPCSTAAADESCAGELVDRYGPRLHRRALTEAERAEYLAHYTSISERSDFTTGLKWTLVAMLQSPATVYRSELGTLIEDGTYALTPEEVATNLAYTFTGTTPSPELIKKAQSGGLSTPEARQAEAKSLVEGHPQGFLPMRRFFEEWLTYGRILGQTRAGEPEFAEVVSPLLIEETRIFLDQIVFGDGDGEGNQGTFANLMTAPFTTLNGRLTEFYGFGETDDWARVARPADRGLGILAQGSILATTSHQTATSPTQRGLMFAEKFLCNTRPVIPENIPSLEETTEGSGAVTTRQRYEDAHGMGVCKACHVAFEPYGYTFEQFDQTGRYRPDEGGQPIDTATFAPWSSPKEIELANLDDLSRQVESSSDVQACVSGLLTTYFLSGGGGVNCLSEETRAEAISGERSIKDYLLSLAASGHFAHRVNGAPCSGE